MSRIKVSRRSFLAGTAALAAGPTIISCSSLKQGKRPAPSDRLNVGFIGYGTMAQDNIGNFLNNDRVQVVSVCDPVYEAGLYGYSSDPNRKGGRIAGKRRVDEFYAQKLNKAGYNACKTFIDFRELLADPGLDAVVISTPDHWHAIQAICAARAGKHIYGQKPLSLCIAEGRAMADTVKACGVTFQTGSQQRSDNYFRMACEFVRNGRIGKLKRIEVGLPGGFIRCGRKDEDYVQEPRPLPSWFSDFDIWLGPAKKRDFMPGLHNPLTWRNNFDYSGGLITDWGAHHLDIVQWALGKDKSGPIAIENAKGDLPSFDAPFNVAKSYSFEVVYEDGTRVFVSDRFQNGIKFYGENDKTIFVTRGKLETTPMEIMREKIKDGEVKLYKSSQHEANFVDCVYTGAETITPCETGHRSITIAHLANIALRQGKSTVKWNPAAERFVNDSESDKLLTAPMRAPWLGVFKG